eukprot:12787136-Alexandrium_andersonii.AAC.3
MHEDGPKEPSKTGGDLQGAEIPGPLRARLLGNPYEKIQGRAEDTVERRPFLCSLVQGLTNQDRYQVLAVLQNLIGNPVHSRGAASRRLQDAQDGLPCGGRGSRQGSKQGAALLHVMPEEGVRPRGPWRLSGPNGLAASPQDSVNVGGGRHPTPVRVPHTSH